MRMSVCVSVGEYVRNARYSAVSVMMHLPRPPPDPQRRVTAHTRPLTRRYATQCAFARRAARAAGPLRPGQGRSDDGRRLCVFRHPGTRAQNTDPTLYYINKFTSKKATATVNTRSEI